MTAGAPGRRTMTSGPSVAFAGIAFGAATAFATTLILGNVVGASGTGSVFQFIAVFSIAGTILMIGADTGLVRFLAAARALGRIDQAPALLRKAGVPVLITTILGIALAYFLVLDPFDRRLLSDGVVEILIPATPFLAALTLLSLALGALRGLGLLGAFTAIQNVGLPLARLVAVVVLISTGFSIVGLALAWLLPLVAALAAAVVILRRALRTAGPIRGTGTLGVGQQERGLRADDARSMPRAFWSFSATRGVGSVLEIVLEWVDVLAVGVLLGPAAAGVYGVVTRCVRVGQMVDHAVRVISSPAISASIALGTRERTQSIFLVSGRVLVLLAWPFYLLLLIYGSSILRLFGPGFEEGLSALTVISGAMLVAVTAGGVQSMLLMGGKSQWQVLNKCVALAVALVLNLTLIPALGLAGAAIAWASAVLVDCGLATLQVRRQMGIRLPVRQLWLPAGLALICFGLPLLLVRLLLGATPLSLGVGVVSAGLIFLAALWIVQKRLGVERLFLQLRDAVDTRDGSDQAVARERNGGYATACVGLPVGNA